MKKRSETTFFEEIQNGLQLKMKSEAIEGLVDRNHPIEK